MSNVTPPSVPAAWYPDPAGTSRLRWFDGSAWTEHYHEEAPVAAEPAAAEAPAAEAPEAEEAVPEVVEAQIVEPEVVEAEAAAYIQPAYTQPPVAAPAYAAQPGYPAQQPAYTQQPYNAVPLPSAPAGINVYTPFIWLIVLLPMLPSLLLLTIDWGGMFGSIDPNNPASAMAVYGIFLSPSYWGAVLLGWVLYGLNVFFAYRDRAYLASVGIAQPFHWAWTFLSSLVYVIGRTIVVGRRTGGLGKTPMWVAFGTIAVSIIVVIVMMVQMFSAMSSLFSRF